MYIKQFLKTELHDFSSTSKFLPVFIEISELTTLNLVCKNIFVVIELHFFTLNSCSLNKGVIKNVPCIYKKLNKKLIFMRCEVNACQIW